MDNQDLIKKVSYIKGLADGIKLSDKSDEGKIISQLIDVIDSIVGEITLINDDIDDVMDTVDELDDCLCVVADDVEGLYSVLNEDDMFDYDEDDFDTDDFGGYDDDEFDDEFDEDFEDDGELFELECPACGEDVMVDFDMLDDGETIICPNCHKEIELEIDYDCDCDDDDCDCGHCE